MSTAPARANSGVDDAAAMLQRIRGEFREMPGLTLTIAQASRLWQLEPATSRQFLDALVVDGILLRRPDGVYLVATDVAILRMGRGVEA